MHVQAMCEYLEGTINGSGLALQIILLQRPGNSCPENRTLSDGGCELVSQLVAGLTSKWIKEEQIQGC